MTTNTNSAQERTASIDRAQLDKLPNEQEMLDTAFAAGLYPNSIHHWMPALQRYTKELLARRGLTSGMPAEPVGEIVADDPIHGWHMHAYKPWNEIGAGTKLYARPVEAGAAAKTEQAGDVELIRVPAHEADSYCRILTILGMEQEGDPVAEVQRLFDADSAAGAGSAQQPAEVPLWDENGEPWNLAAEQVEYERAQAARQAALTQMIELGQEIGAPEVDHDHSEGGHVD